MENSDWKDANSPQRTHYSKSRNRLESLNTWLIDTSFSYMFAKVWYFDFAGGLGLNFQRWSFTDQLLSYQYPDDQAQNLDSYIDKNTVSYNLIYFFPELIFTAIFTYKIFELSSSFRYGFLAIIDDFDHHKVRDTVFHYRIFPGNHIGIDVKVSFKIRFIEINLGFSYKNMLETKGYTMIEHKEKYQNQVLSNRSGNSSERFSLNLGLGISIPFPGEAAKTVS